MTCVLALLPIALARFPPTYDSYQWMFQGHLVARWLPWGVAAVAIALQSLVS